MASPITKAQLDCNNILKSLTDIPGDSGNGPFRYVNLWDEQIDNMFADSNPGNMDMSGSLGYSFDMPAAFVEFIPGECTTLGMGITSYPDGKVRLHLCNFLLNNGDDMEQNLVIFEIRDKVKAAFQLAKPSWMSALQCCEDQLDYKHGNTYKYVIAFKTNFIDTKGSIYDEDADVINYTFPDPANNLEINNFFQWEPKTYIASGNARIYNEIIYLCTTGNADEVFDEANWLAVLPWQAKKAYTTEYAAFGKNIYQCSIPNSDATFTPSNWNLIV